MSFTLQSPFRVTNPSAGGPDARTDKLSIDEKFRIRELLADGWGCGEIAEMLGRSRPTIYNAKAEIDRLAKKARDKDPVAYRMAEIESEALDSLMADSSTRKALIGQVQERLLERLGMGAPAAAERTPLAEKIVTNLINTVAAPLLLGMISQQGGLDPAALMKMLGQGQAAPPQPAAPPQVTVHEEPQPSPPAIEDMSQPDPADTSAPPASDAGSEADVKALDDALAFMVELIKLEPEAAAYQARIRILAEPKLGQWLQTDGRLMQALAGGPLGKVLAPRPGGPELLAFIATEAGVQWWDTLRKFLEATGEAA